MKTFRIRSVFWGANVSLSIFLGLIMFGGLEFFGKSAVSWGNAAYLMGGGLLLLLAVNLGLLSFLVIAPLQQFLFRAQSFGKLARVAPEQKFRLRELAELAQFLDANAQALNAVVQAGNAFLDQGERPNLPPGAAHDPVGQTFQRFVQTISAVEEHISEIIKGNLFMEVPAAIRETRLGGALRAMTLELRTITARIRKETKSISMVSARIAGMSQQGSRNAITETQAIENIASAIHQVAANLREVKQNIGRQGDSLDQTFTDIQDMLMSTEQTNSSIELLSASAEATARSISEIHEFMQEIERHAQSLARISETISTEAKDGGQAVGEVITGIQTIKTTVEDAATAIQRLGEESDRIGEILAVINGVAEQTNLLALNASIIAAQAGEQGRGFAVVAGEIKELAERTRTSTKEIETIIRSLQAEVGHGSVAMQRCLTAVRQGVGLANRSGEILAKIVRSIQGAHELASTLAQATVTQTENSHQVHAATEQIMLKIEELYATASKQAQDSTHLAEMANILKDVTLLIDQAASTQLQAVDAIVHAMEDIQDMVQRNAKIAHQLATSSEELGDLESHLAEDIGHFLVTKPALPPDFDPNQPTIAFIYPGAPFFYHYIYQGIRQTAAANRFQPIALDSRNDPVLQAEYVTWLLRQGWLEGIIIAPFDEQTGGDIVMEARKRHIPLVVVDRSAKNAHLAVFSDNKQGGESAAEIMREKLPGEATVLVCGPRNITPIFNRMEGFFKKAKTYRWQIAEVFTSTMNINEAKQSIMEGLRSNSGAQGIFVTNEHASSAYLELLREGKIPPGKFYVIGYDINPEIAAALLDGRLLATIFQDPPKLGSTAMQEILTLLQQPAPEKPAAPKVVLVPVKKITKANLPAEWLPAKSS